MCSQAEGQCCRALLQQRTSSNISNMCAVPTEYVAMGDSFASGAGAPQSTWDSLSGDCARSSDSWAYDVRSHIASVLGESPPFKFVACGGANVTTVREGQLKALSNTTTRWVTLSVGGNDLDFASTISECLFFKVSSNSISHDCTDAVKAREEQLPELKKTLVALYKEIQTLAPKAQVLVLGYPYLASRPYGAATVGLPGPFNILSQSEVDALRTGVNKAAETIEEACAEAGVHFVDMRPASDGKACGGTPELLNCLILSPSKRERFRSFHPNTAGNAAYGEVVVEKLNSIK